MKLSDAIMIHWTGGIGMFGILKGEMWLGILTVITAQLAYELLSRKNKRRG